MTSGPLDPRHVRALVIGAGFAGIAAAVKLALSGRDFVVLERGDSVGGTWRDNIYPGAQCDVPSRVYSYSFELNPDWRRTYSGQGEIHAYLQRTAARYGVLDRVALGCRVTAAWWDASAHPAGCSLAVTVPTSAGSSGHSERFADINGWSARRCTWHRRHRSWR